MPANPSYIDINGIFQVEKNYLDTIRNNPNIDISQLNNLQAKLQAGHDSLASSNAATSQLYTEQDKVLGIINVEKDRLDRKKHSVTDALDGQNRLITLNESHRLRNNDYISMISTSVICLFLLVTCSAVGRLLPVIPPIVIDILYILIISITIYILYASYLAIQSRDKLYYNELNLAGPKILTADEIKKQNELAAAAAAAAPAANLLSTIANAGCVNALCCKGESVWDSVNSVCTTGNLITGSVRTGFTTLDLAYLNGELLLNPERKMVVSPNTPHEFDRYSKI